MTPSMPRQMKLAVFVSNAGAHPGGWRYPGAQSDLMDFDLYRRMADIAERGKFHVYFSGDAQGYHHIEGREAFASSDSGGKFEPLTLLAALSMTTRDIGLVATASTTYNEPYAMARRFASLDHLSKGRAGWNVVTSTSDSEARNFGLAENVEHDLRYERAEEFVDVVKGLWDSWEDDAFLRDQAAARYFDPAKLHALGHKGRFFNVEGPLNVARPPQGHPIIVQAGGSDVGRNLAARTADLIFTAQPSLEKAQAFYADIKARVAGFGRDPDQALVFPSMQILVRSTEAEAKAAQDELRDLVPPPLALSKLQTLLGGVDLSAFDPDQPLPDLPVTQGGQWVQAQIIELGRTQNLTIRQLASRYSISRAAYAFTGTPEQAADMLEAWFTGRAADGVSLAPDYHTGSLENFVDQVVPILQRRGLFRTEYEGATLRDNLGLPRPANRFVENPALHVEPSIWAKLARNA